MSTPKKTRVAVCMPMARGAHPATMRSLVRLMAADPFNDLYDEVGFPVDVARNQITAVALSNPDVTHLLWIDDDMVFDPEIARRLLTYDLPIVGGLCHGRRDPYAPILIYFTERGSSFRWKYPRGLVKVDATGGAFLLVKREVFEKIGPDPWRPDGYGEDLSFCMRAGKAGFDIYVDTRAEIGHIAEVTIDSKMSARCRNFIFNPYTPPEEMRIATGDPVATIVIPTYNEKPEKLRAAIMSAMFQTAPVEIIVIDNGSDVPVTLPIGNESMPAHPHLRLIRVEKNPGHPWDALNLGIREMSTPWFAWLSSDDLLYPNKIERQLRLTPGVASAHGYDVMIRDRMMAKTVIMPPAWTSPSEQCRMLAAGCWINGLTLMAHRTVLDAVEFGDGHYFNPEIRIASDWDLWNRIAQHAFITPIQEALATRRSYDNASERYQADPEMRAVWKAEDAMIRQRYGGSPL